MIIEKTIKFLLHKRNPGDTKNLGIRMRVTIKGQPPIDFSFPRNVRIDADDWDFEKMRPNQESDNPVLKDVNRTIADWSEKMDDVFARYEIIEKRTPTNDEVKMLFNDFIGKKSIFDASDKPGFFQVFDMFTETMGDKTNGRKAHKKSSRHCATILKSSTNVFPWTCSMMTRHMRSSPIFTDADSVTQRSRNKFRSSNGSCDGRQRPGSILDTHMTRSSRN